MKKTLNTIILQEILNTAKYNTDVDIQRNFIWKDKQVVALIDSIQSNISLGEIKAWKVDENVWDIIDGKQRITTIREFINGNLKGPNDQIWSNWDERTQNKFLQQKINIAYQSGTFSEKVKAYININEGEPLTDWEKIHALCYGTLVKDIEDAFTQDESLIKVFGGSYKKTRGMSCLSALRFLLGYDKTLIYIQNYLNQNKDNTWVEYERLAACCKWTIEVFNQYDEDLDCLALIAWKHREKREEWFDNKIQINEVLENHLFNKDKKYRTCSLYVYYCNFLKCWNMSDLDPKRFFTPEDKREIWKRNRQKYPEPYEYYANYQIDHIIPWSRGGRTILENGQLLTPEQNASKGNKNLLDE